jgi:hypothetical protein
MAKAEAKAEAKADAALKKKMASQVCLVMPMRVGFPSNTTYVPR